MHKHIYFYPEKNLRGVVDREDYHILIWAELNIMNIFTFVLYIKDRRTYKKSCT